MMRSSHATNNRTQEVTPTTRVEEFALPSALLASVTHDLRNPLSVILGASEVLQDGYAHLGDEDRHSYLGAIRRECLRIDEYIQGLFHVARLMVGGSSRLARERVEVLDIVDSAVERLSRYHHDVRVTVDAPASLKPVEAQGVLVAQALLNVLDNAAKFSPRGASVDLAIAQDAAGITHIEVADAGPGIPLDQRERVFATYVSGDPQARGRGGSGLGLAISRSILRAHGGDLVAEEPRDGGTGARMRLTLPIREPMRSEL